MSHYTKGSIAKEHEFFYSLLGALAGVGLISLAVYLGAKGDFLATLLIKGGDISQYAYGLAIATLLLVGIVLIGRHIFYQDEAEGYYEQTPY